MLMVPTAMTLTVVVSGFAAGVGDEGIVDAGEVDVSRPAY